MALQPHLLQHLARQHLLQPTCLLACRAADVAQSAWQHRCLATSNAAMMAAQPAQEPPREQEPEPSPSQQQQQQAHSQQASQQEAGSASSEHASASASSGTSSSSYSAAADDVKQKVFSAFRSAMGGGPHGAGGSTGGSHPGMGASQQAQHGGLLRGMAKEVGDVFRSADNIRSATRRYTGPVMQFAEGDTTTTALQLVRQPQTSWQRLQEKLSEWPLFNKLWSFKVTDTGAYKRGQEMVEDLKDKYETSDHPMVHKVDEVKEKLLSGSERSRAMLEVRMRDPTFDLNNFVKAIKMDARVVVSALLRRDMDTLALHLGPEMMERLGGVFRVEAERGWEDPAILFTSDVEIIEVRQMDGDPFVVAQFHCQQIKCVRDAFGNVVEGSPDAIQRVYYFWGLQQEAQGVVTADGQVLPPRWVIRDMMWQSMLALV